MSRPVAQKTPPALQAVVETERIPPVLEVVAAAERIPLELEELTAAEVLGVVLSAVMVGLLQAGVERPAAEASHIGRKT